MIAKYTILAAIVLMCIAEKSVSQDIHFSQNDVTPLLNNPALTGIFMGNHRVTINYKEQWKSVASPYKTTALQYDGSYFKSKLQVRDKIGLGVALYNDKAGDGNMGINQVNLSGSYYKSLSRYQGLSAGFMLGYVQHTLDKQNLSWGNQYDGNYNPSLNTGESAYNDNLYSYMDFGTGVMYDYRKDKTFSFNVGASLQHANYIKLTFMDEQNQNLFRKFTVHGALEKKIKKSETTFYPSFVYRKQGPASEFIYGCLIKYQLSEEGRVQGNILETAINFGVYHRYGDAFIFVTRFSYMHFTVGLSYDVNASKLSDVSHYKGGLELCLIYVTPYVKRSKGNTLL